MTKKLRGLISPVISTCQKQKAQKKLFDRIRTRIGRQNWIAEKYSAGQVLLTRFLEDAAQRFAPGERRRTTTPINSLLFTLVPLQTPCNEMKIKRCQNYSWVRDIFVRCVPFFNFFSSDSQICVVGFWKNNYSIRASWIWNDHNHCASHWLYIISYPARPCRINVKYI